MASTFVWDCNMLVLLCQYIHVLAVFRSYLLRSLDCCLVELVLRASEPPPGPCETCNFQLDSICIMHSCYNNVMGNRYYICIQRFFLHQGHHEPPPPPHRGMNKTANGTMADAGKLCDLFFKQHPYVKGAVYLWHLECCTSRCQTLNSNFGG